MRATTVSKCLFFAEQTKFPAFEEMRNDPKEVSDTQRAHPYAYCTRLGVMSRVMSGVMSGGRP